MTDFLLYLCKLNVAMGVAIILACLLRRPVRAQFGSQIAYAIWLLVPLTSLASLLPPRVEALSSTHLSPVQSLAAPMFAIRQIAYPALQITRELAGPNALMHPVTTARAAASGYGMPDYAMLLFAAWALGAVLTALYLARLQVRFYASVRLGEAGPAVVGFFRPRIVMPCSFREEFSAAEQAAILAHERVHLVRQDARINALAALLRCLCWFDPLVHLGAALLRVDQELACDAAALGGPVSRRDYANALVKSQMTVIALPLGCNWPGFQHPLIERVALLKRKPPGAARRIAGAGFVTVATTIAGLGAWAAQPPVPANFAATPHRENQIAPALSRIESLAPSDDRLTAPTQLHEEDYVVSRRNRLASVRATRPSLISEISLPSLIAQMDLPPALAPDNGPVNAVSQADEPSAPADVASAVPSSFTAQTMSADQYPAPNLSLNASHGLGGLNKSEAIDYCRNYAEQTVNQGANRPISVDEGVKQRLSFFYWRCMQRNADAAGPGPAYSPVGAASPDHPVNVAGSWAVSFPAWSVARSLARSCIFEQTGNSLSGTCARSEGVGTAYGVVDGRQVRWTWKYFDDEKRTIELDFIGMVGPDGSMSGQSIAIEPSHLYQLPTFSQIVPFTAVPSAPAVQVASQK